MVPKHLFYSVRLVLVSVSPFLDMKNMLHTIAKITGSHTFYTGTQYKKLY